MQRQACGFLLPRESPNRPACMSVRDRIPELLAERGVPFEARNASKAELPGLLLAKLDEEIAEYLADAGDLARAEELADVLEVVVGVGGLCGADRDSVESLRARKAEERRHINSTPTVRTIPAFSARAALLNQKTPANLPAAAAWLFVPAARPGDETIVRFGRV